MQIKFSARGGAMGGAQTKFFARKFFLEFDWLKPAYIVCAANFSPLKNPQFVTSVVKGLMSATLLG